eukprot:jgi/Mesvir1/23265/Mv12879-RA.1
MTGSSDSDSGSEDDAHAAAIRSCAVDPSSIGKSAQAPGVNKPNARNSDGVTGEKLSHRQVQIGEALQRYLEKELAFSNGDARGTGKEGGAVLGDTEDGSDDISAEGGGFRFFRRVSPGQPPVLPHGNERVADGGGRPGRGQATPSGKNSRIGAFLGHAETPGGKNGDKGRERSKNGGGDARSSDTDSSSSDEEKEKLLSVVVDAAFITASAAKAAVAARKNIVSVDDEEGKGRRILLQETAPAASGVGAATPAASAPPGGAGDGSAAQASDIASPAKLSKKARKAMAALAREAGDAAPLDGPSSKQAALRDDEPRVDGRLGHGSSAGDERGREDGATLRDKGKWGIGLDGEAVCGGEGNGSESHAKKMKEKKKKRKSQDRESDRQDAASGDSKRELLERGMDGVAGSHAAEQVLKKVSTTLPERLDGAEEGEGTPLSAKEKKKKKKKRKEGDAASADDADREAICHDEPGVEHSKPREHKSGKKIKKHRENDS